MQITTGRGNKRQTVEIPANLDRETREKIGWNLKQMMLERGIIQNLGGGPRR